MINEDITRLKSFLSIPRDITIIAHRNPDGDALGSSLGLRIYLEKKGHSVKVVMPSESPNTFSYLPHFYDVIVFDLKHDIAREALKKADCIFCLDFNGLDRVDKLGPVINDSKAKKVLIDHHLDPEPFVDFMFSDTEASSTCELVYTFIDDMGDAQYVDNKIGECLFTGLITDTGSFKYNTRANTYTVASKLKAVGVDDYYIQDKIHNSAKPKVLMLLGHCLANRMEIIEEYGAGLIYLTKEDYITFDIQRGDTEGIVNYMLMIKNVNVAALITEQPTIVKISLRSKGDISVQAIASKHFKGGGHKNASGGALYAPLNDVISRFKRILPDYLPKNII
ncbi:MAG: bifunctional oligoribonuclease/PAP phosphatase NrnA [Saprospiraceae bacterium]